MLNLLFRGAGGGRKAGRRIARQGAVVPGVTLPPAIVKLCSRRAS